MKRKPKFSNPRDTAPGPKPQGRKYCCKGCGERFATRASRRQHAVDEHGAIVLGYGVLKQIENESQSR